MTTTKELTVYINLGNVRDMTDNVNEFVTAYETAIAKYFNNADVELITVNASGLTRNPECNFMNEYELEQDLKNILDTVARDF